MRPPPAARVRTAAAVSAIDGWQLICESLLICYALADHPAEKVHRERTRRHKGSKCQPASQPVHGEPYGSQAGFPLRYDVEDRWTPPVEHASLPSPRPVSRFGAPVLGSVVPSFRRGSFGPSDESLSFAPSVHRSQYSAEGLSKRKRTRTARGRCPSSPTHFTSTSSFSMINILFFPTLPYPTLAASDCSELLTKASSRLFGTLDGWNSFPSRTSETVCATTGFVSRYPAVTSNPSSSQSIGAFSYIRICVCVCVCIFMYVCTYVCVRITPAQ